MGRSKSMAMRTGVDRSGNRSRNIVADGDDFNCCAAKCSKRSPSVGVDDFSDGLFDIVVVGEEITLGAGDPSIWPTPPKALNEGTVGLYSSPR